MKALLLVVLFGCFGARVGAEESGPTRLEKIDSGTGSIVLHVFMPSKANSKRSAIVLLHGGGWTEGDATWMYGQAERFTQLGLVAVAVDYRLSDQKTLTPFDAVGDVRQTLRWMRKNASQLNINPEKIIALGTSAGGHLAASAAVFNETYGGQESAQPNALILRSAAIAPAQDNWFRQLVGGQAQAAALSPDRFIRAGLPPTLLLQGEKDNVTPASRAIAFCDRLREQHNVCQIEVYAGVGHLFTRNLQNQEIPDYDAIDQEVSQKANDRALAFLRDQGFLD